jgi:hypothetical protein
LLKVASRGITQGKGLAIEGLDEMTIDEIDALVERNPIPEVERAKLESRRFILDLVGEGGVGAEIGVFRGWFSEQICRTVKPRKLYLIDPWRCLGETFGWGADTDYTNFGRLTTADALKEARLRCGRFPDVEAVFIEGFFPSCADQIVDELDWAYLDASHNHAKTLAELRALDRCVKPDGLILGDDWKPDPHHPHFGVITAVHEFVATSDWRFRMCGRAQQWALCRY